jgi:hypothetical protein
MSKARALAAIAADELRGVIVCGCALALILAAGGLPF